MNINCISCGHKFDVGRSYDDYDGPVRCSTCRALLMIRTQDGNLRSVRPGSLSAMSEPQAVAQHDYQRQVAPQDQVPQGIPFTREPAESTDQINIRRTAA